MASDTSSSLRELAALYGVSTEYYDVEGVRRVASDESLLAILEWLGAGVDDAHDVADAAAFRHQQLWQRVVEPVCVAWNGRDAQITIRMPEKTHVDFFGARIEFENGLSDERGHWLSRLPIVSSDQVSGAGYVAYRLSLPDALPFGYHDLIVNLGGKVHRSLLISAPERAYDGSDAQDESERSDRGRNKRWAQKWGVFAPVYALRSQRSLGAGDLADLRRLMQFVSQRGGDLVGTLPLLAAFLDLPFEPSPYAPASRLLWNEFFVAIDSLPELDQQSEASALIDSEPFQLIAAARRADDLVDYARVMALKRHLLQWCAKQLWSSSG
ncbi:MAG: 4-alpha-glucanotransferase, partial [Acidobacteriota bacterium]